MKLASCDSSLKHFTYNKKLPVTISLVVPIKFLIIHYIQSQLSFTVLCRLVGRDPCPKLKLFYVNFLLCEHAEVVNHTVYTAAHSKNGNLHLIR